MDNKMVKLGILVGIAAAIWFSPVPTGLSPIAWHSFAIYFAAILGLVLKPFPTPVVILAAVAAVALFTGEAKGALSGYSSTTTWLVFAAFSLSIGFVETGLGRRIAYLLINRLGSTMLGLGYVTALLDLFISPVTPSNTARSGGIVTPIMVSTAVAVGSEPGETAKKGGSFLLVNTYMVTKVTSFMFLTAMGPNLLATDYMANILHVKIDWMMWFNGLFVPGLLLLFLVPAFVYALTRPSVKKLDNKKIASEGLRDLGPMTVREKKLLVLFIMALVGWMAPSLAQIAGFKLKIDATAVAITVMACSFMFGVISWGDMLKAKGGWNTLIWFGGIIGLSSVLTKAKFFIWLAAYMQANMSFGSNPTIALWIIVFVSVAVRYLFASGSAYVAAMLPVFLTVGLASGANPVALAFALSASNSYGGSLTHYGGAAAPIIFGAGYNTTSQWWIVGGLFALLCYFFMMTVGFAWWKVCGFI